MAKKQSPGFMVRESMLTPVNSRIAYCVSLISCNPPWNGGLNTLKADAFTIRAKSASENFFIFVKSPFNSCKKYAQIVFLSAQYMSAEVKNQVCTPKNACLCNEIML